MKKNLITEAQVAFALRQAESRTTVAEIIRKLGISELTFYRGKKRYAGRSVAEIQETTELISCACPENINFASDPNYCSGVRSASWLSNKHARDKHWLHR